MGTIARRLSFQTEDSSTSCTLYMFVLYEIPLT